MTAGIQAVAMASFSTVADTTGSVAALTPWVTSACPSQVRENSRSRPLQIHRSSCLRVRACLRILTDNGRNAPPRDQDSRNHESIV